jgi:hypothetical protein
MALVPGWVAVLRIVPPGNKVALGETVRRVLSASSTPRVVFGGGDARRKLARNASRWTRAAWGAVPRIPSSLAVVSARGSMPFFVARSSPRQGKLPRRWQRVCTGTLCNLY